MIVRDNEETVPNCFQSRLERLTFLISLVPNSNDASPVLPPPLKLRLTTYGGIEICILLLLLLLLLLLF